MSTVRDRVYQTSDLAGAARKEFIEAAREAEAHFRTPDGDALVMTRQARLEHLASIRDYAMAYLMLTSATRRPRDQRRAADFGPWAFMDVFDDDDLAEFADEINAALVKAVAAQETSGAEAVLEAWRRSARTLSDPTARAILDGHVDEDDWVAVGRPAEA